MDLSIIIVNYNVKEFLSNLLHSLRNAVQPQQTEIIVVDNASEDGSAELIKARFPEVKLIESKVNRGFAGGNNLALEIATGKYILFINPDTLVEPDTLDVMMKFMDANAETGLAGCKILNPDGTLQLACRRGFPGPWTAFCKVTGLSQVFPKSRLFARYNLTYLDENESYEVDAVSGSFMMMRRSVYEKIGGLDEQFFMYGEDLDLCYRVQKSGSKVFYVHKTQITHYKGESTRRSTIDETRVFYNAMRLFVRKHLSGSSLVELLLMLAISLRESAAFLGRWRLLFIPLLFDAAFFNLSLFVSENLYRGVRLWRGFPDEALVAVYTIPAFLLLFSGFLVGVYQKDRIVVLRSIAALVISFFILSSVTYFFRDFAYSRAVLIMTYLFAGVFFILWRAVVKVLFKTGNVWAGRTSQKTLIIGTGAEASHIAALLRDKMMYQYRVTAYISKEQKETGTKIEGLEVAGTLETLHKVIRERDIREVIFTAGEFELSEIFYLCAGLHNENVGLKIAGKEIDYLLGRKELTLLENYSLIDFSLNLAVPGYRAVKRLFDIVASLLLGLFLSPLFLLSGRLRRNREAVRMFSSLVRVISGSMSLVGSAPADAPPRFPLKCGVTGFWFTENEKSENFTKLDMFYARNQNIWLDVEILSRTLLIIFAGR